ncbi:MAG: hypothetical protein WEB33_02915 [Bacteroidota bacterium]
MRLYAIFFSLFLLSVPAIANDQQKILTLKKIQQAVQVDGLIEPMWFQADSAATFFQLQPYSLASRRAGAQWQGS